VYRLFHSEVLLPQKIFAPFILGYERCATECFVASAFLRTLNGHTASRDLDEPLALLRFRFTPQHRIEVEK
jgi:hypothetical protein